jgi:hypothetical protein
MSDQLPKTLTPLQRSRTKENGMQRQYVNKFNYVPQNTVMPVTTLMNKKRLISLVKKGTSQPFEL